MLRHDAACFAWQILGVSDWIEDSRSVSGSSPKAEIFDVFLCHNSEDKPAVREIAQKLSEENIKPWLDEAEIRPETSGTRRWTANRKHKIGGCFCWSDGSARGRIKRSCSSRSVR